MEFFEDVYRIINKYNQKAKLPKTYGTEDLLYMSEIHMIEIIGSEEEVTNGKLTKILGITKGAVSQTVTKLEEKNHRRSQRALLRKDGQHRDDAGHHQPYRFKPGRNLPLL